MLKNIPKFRFYLLSFSGIILALFFSEVFLRVADFIPPAPLTEKSTIFGFDHIPNASAVYKSNEYSVKVYINADGLRDYEVKKDKPSNTKRIAIIGDSFVEGLQVELDKTVAKRLQSILNEKGNNEVINFGVSGFGMDQKYLYLREKVLAYNPDLVILFLSSNDFDDVKNNNIVARVNRNLNFRLTPLDSAPQKLLKDFLKKTYLANFIFLTIKQKSQTNKSSLPIEYKLFQGKVDDETNYFLNIVKDLISESKRVSNINDADFILVIGADRIQVKEREAERFRQTYQNYQPTFLNTMISQFAKDNNIIYLDLLPILKDQIESGRNVYFESDGHWNEHGHEMVAESIAQFLENFSPYEN